MNESNLWEWLRDVALPLGQYSRIESPDTAPGFPDVFYQLPSGSRGARGTKEIVPIPGMGVCGTIELKCNMRPAKVPFPVEDRGLHQSQLRWIREYYKVGGLVLIIAVVPGVIYIIHGKDAEKFNGATHEELAEMAWDTISRDDPKTAATILDAMLRVPGNYRLFAEYY